MEPVIIFNLQVYIGQLISELRKRSPIPSHGSQLYILNTKGPPGFLKLRKRLGLRAYRFYVPGKELSKHGSKPLCVRVA